MTGLEARAAQVETQIELMVEYLRMRSYMRDWHGVMDAAADLRELEVEKRLLREQVEVEKARSK